MKITKMKTVRIKNWQAIGVLIIGLGSLIASSIHVVKNNIEAQKVENEASIKYSKELGSFEATLDTLEKNYYIVNKKDFKLQKYVRKRNKNYRGIKGVISNDNK